MKKCGLLGKVLAHSYSPAIHKMLADYEYRLYEKTEDELTDFIKEGEWDGLNVTIPYKKKAAELCDELSSFAEKIGSCNTLVKRADGSIFGDNTDAYGFLKLVEYSKINVSEKKCLILGSGGASVSVCAALKSLGAETVIISRQGENNYGNLEKHKDARVIVNTTPVGMYPDNGKSPLKMDLFTKCEGVIDIIYNPFRTALMLQAEKMGIPAFGGLYMLVGQAKRSAELFSGEQISESEIHRIVKVLESDMKNIILIGMPGCGKTTAAKLLGRALNREVLDSDAEIIKNTGMSIPDYMQKNGEAMFRDRESEAIAALGKLSGKIIATGGGCITRDENYDSLHQNGTIFWIKRDPERLARKGRPLSENADLNKMYEVRKPGYERFADVIIDNNKSKDETVKAILTQSGFGLTMH